MDKFIGVLKGQWKVNYNKVCIDTAILRLHYKFTFYLLISFSVIVTTTQLIGENIKCISETKEAEKPLQTYCFISSTFSLPKWYQQKPGSETAVKGLGSYGSEDDVKHHAYYQWVSFVLFGQALMFYFPHFLWKMWEGGKIKSIIQGLHIFNWKAESSGQNKKKCALLSDYFTNALHAHSWWAGSYFFCEALTLFHVVAQIFLTNAFLGGEFLRYGLEVLQFLDMDPEDRIDPMSRVFPRVTKCTFHKYGPSGTIQTIDIMCILPLNIINEKIYTFLWFWFVILAIISGLDFLLRIATLVSRTVQCRILQLRLSPHLKKRVKQIVSRCQTGDWLVLRFLKANMDPMSFESFIEELATNLNLPMGNVQSKEYTALKTT